jgi:hypothetical protein
VASRPQTGGATQGVSKTTAGGARHLQHSSGPGARPRQRDAGHLQHGSGRREATAPTQGRRRAARGVSDAAADDEIELVPLSLQALRHTGLVRRAGEAVATHRSGSAGEARLWPMRGCFRRGRREATAPTHGCRGRYSDTRQMELRCSTWK